MQPKTELFLYMLLWTLGTAMRPTFRNLDESFEGWAYRNGFLRQIKALEAGGYLEKRAPSGPDARVCRLTERGRLHALGGRDPEVEWSRRWDGQWRMVLFDIGEHESTRRDKLRRYLRSRGFGCLQLSVWVSPHPLEAESITLKGAAVDAGSLILLDARPGAGESDAEIVRAAWDFTEINKRYAAVIGLLDGQPREAVRSAADARRLHDWARRERAAWLRAVEVDPLLPRILWPSGYLGGRAWQRRKKAFREAGQMLSHFTTPRE